MARATSSLRSGTDYRSVEQLEPSCQTLEVRPIDFPSRRSNDPPSDALHANLEHRTILHREEYLTDVYATVSVDADQVRVESCMMVF